jgi:lipopolysaccharide/colanic/teichoic acid biosynthesis glycosyltransferase
LFKTALLKRASLHALPRLFNVMKGEMALVGPEPERPQFAARLAAEIPFYPQRQQVRPGLTGWEQLHRNAVKLPDTVTSFEYDLYYVKHLSLSLDSIVLLLALRKLLFGELAAV